MFNVRLPFFLSPLLAGLAPRSAPCVAAVVMRAEIYLRRVALSGERKRIDSFGGARVLASNNVNRRGTQMDQISVTRKERTKIRLGEAPSSTADERRFHGPPENPNNAQAFLN